MESSDTVRHVEMWKLARAVAFNRTMCPDGDRDDAVVDIYLKLMGCDTSGVRDVRRYLNAVAGNAHADYIRHCVVRARFTRTLDLEHLCDTLLRSDSRRADADLDARAGCSLAAVTSALEVDEQLELAAFVEHAMGMLSATEQAIVRGRADGLSYREIAESIGKSVQAVKIATHRMQRRMNAIFDGEAE